MLSPAANPIIQRELISTLRTRRAVLLQLLLVLMLALLVVMRWPSDAMVTSAGANKAAQALEVLRVFGYGLMTSVILMAPAFPAASIVRERQQGTLALLLNSPMTAGDILLGKVVASMGFVVLVMVLTLPMAAACYNMGGVTLGQLIGLYLVLLLLGLEYTAVGLFVSSKATSSDSSLRLTYGAVLVLAVLSLGPHQLGQAVAGGLVASVLDWIRAISPIPAVAENLGQAFGTRGAMRTTSMTLLFVIMTLLITGVLLWLTWRRLSSRLLDRPRAVEAVTEEQSAQTRAMRRIMYLWFFDPKRRGELIGPMTNPVMIKEFRTRRFGRSGWLVRLIAVCMVASLLLMWLAAASAKMFASAEAGGVETLGAIIVLLQMALVLLLTPSLASGLISSERESRGWQLLQLTPLSAVSIVTGKLLSVGLVLLLVLLATIPGYVVLILIDSSKSMRVVDVVVTLTLTSLFALLLSATISSVFRQTAAATATAYALLVTLCAGTMLIWVGEDEPFTRSTVEAALRWNPLAAGLEVIGARGFEDYQLVPHNWWYMLVACAVCLVLLVLQTWRLSRPR